MKRLLSTSHQRKLALIEHLFLNPHQKTKDITQVLGYNTVTLTKDITEINMMLDDCGIVQEADFSYSIEFFHTRNIEYIYRRFLQESFEFNILRELIFQSYDSIDDLAETLYTSSSNLRLSIHKINDILELEHGFKIGTLPVRFEGPDDNIINFNVHFLREYYTIPEMFLTESQRKFYWKLYRSSRITKINIDAITFQEFCFYLYGVTMRAKQIDLFNQTKKKPILNAMLNHLVPYKRLFGVELNQNVLLQIESIFENTHYKFSFDELMEDVASDFETRELFNKINKVIMLISQKIDIECLDREELVLYLYNITQLNYGNNTIIFPKYDFFISKIAIRYPGFKEFIYGYVEAIVGKNKVAEFLYHLLIRWPELQKYMRHFPPKMSVGLLINESKNHVIYIKEYIEETFPNMFDIRIINEKQLKKGLSLSLIITDHRPQAETTIPLTSCSFIPTDNQLDTIHSYYRKWLKG